MLYVFQYLDELLTRSLGSLMGNVVVVEVWCRTEGHESMKR